jgi:hypothetical protein
MRSSNSILSDTNPSSESSDSGKTKIFVLELDGTS